MPPLPALRQDLDFMPSPVEDRPGLLIRDSFRYSSAVLIIPPRLVPALACFDGEQTESELLDVLVRINGSADAGPMLHHLKTVLSSNGFLQDEQFHQMRVERHREFAESPVLVPAHAGTGYPDTQPELETVMSAYLAKGESSASMNPPVAIAAPHVSPEGGWECYRAAYSALSPAMSDRTFVVLGTSHYGEPDRFGLTAKPFSTPFGVTRTAPDLLAALQNQPAAKLEDYCHAVEHSIEFQVIFLQSIFGPSIRVLPILVGSFGRSIQQGRAPEANESIARFFDALGELHAREKERLVWILGVDMAHMGKRYGDRVAATADRGEMVEVARRDQERIQRLTAADAGGFWNLVEEGGEDQLKWCGSAPLYTFLKAVPGTRGTLRKYEQWNIDEASIVSFAGITFE